MIKLFCIGLLAIFTVGSAQAVSLSEIIRNCRADGKTYCPSAGYGKPMQACLSAHMKELTPGCQAIVERLNKGEKFSFF
jgi:hypothetical protein